VGILRVTHRDQKFAGHAGKSSHGDRNSGKNRKPQEIKAGMKVVGRNGGIFQLTLNRHIPSLRPTASIPAFIAAVMRFA